MFERGKKDKFENSTLDAIDTDTEQAYGDWKPTSNPQASSDTAQSADVAVIGRSIRIDGDLRGEEDLRIEGDVNGTVQLRNNTLTIGSEGKISANVYAKSVTVDGSMHGDVFASERVSIRKNARVNGNITAPRVSLEDGAKFKGSIEMDPAIVEKSLGTQPGASASPKAVDKTASIGPKSNSELHLSKTNTTAAKGNAKNESLR